jgi:hypothetical protein
MPGAFSACCFRLAKKKAARPGKPNNATFRDFKLICINLILGATNSQVAKVMIMKKILSYLVVSIFLIIQMIFSSCNDNGDGDNNKNELNTQKEVAMVFAKDNMLVFQNYEHINMELAKLNRLSDNDKDSWLNMHGVKTYGQVFRKVIEQEDSISNYYSSLPDEQQKYFLKQPQIFSEIYKKALNDGIIEIVKNGNNEYFDLNLIDKKYADFLNLSGMLIIGQDILSISGCEEKVFLGALKNSTKIDLSNLNASIIREKDSAVKSKSSSEYDWSRVSRPEFYDPNFFGVNRKKVWAEIEAHSNLHVIFSDETDDCARYVYCVFQLKAHAQSINFWGNYVYSSFAPKVIFDAKWEYSHRSWAVDYDPSDNRLCGFYTSSEGKNDFPSYSCYPNPNYSCPTSPFYEVRYGNGCITPLTPEGIIPYNFGRGGLWWSRPIDIYNTDIKVIIDGKSFNFSW